MGYLFLTSSAKRRYYCEQLEDGSIYLSRDGETEYDNTGSIIMSKSQRNADGSFDFESGKNAIIEQAKEQTKRLMGKEEITKEDFKKYLDDIWEYNKNRARQEAQATQERADKKHKACEQILAKRLEQGGGVLESNVANIYLLLEYLNTQNWGGWKLPTMTIGYSCAQYDCDGKQATTIKLDEPIDYDGEMQSWFEVGAPHRHLMKYQQIHHGETMDEIYNLIKTL